ncbi:MAG: dihydroneopterin aldolase, partial [Bacteroidota bacterium]|nr:dihydroneopterin aldolase [Bacteroidota bacterium]
MNTTISLHGAEFFAYHGFYPEEQVLGNRFLVDIEVEYNFGSKEEDNIANTV